ncbi:sensor histidine kinase [Lichenicola sp.]|uniref:sensor histidine kinase n=1 Tax=Lichenicola sp. TaxID=2804529 RepID=UPI003AFFA6C7
MFELSWSVCGSVILLAGTGAALWRQRHHAWFRTAGGSRAIQRRAFQSLGPAPPPRDDPDAPLMESPLRFGTGRTSSGASSGTESNEPERRWLLGELIDLLPHPVIALRHDGHLLHANEAAHAQFGDALASLLRHKLLGDAIQRLAHTTAVDVELAVDVPIRRVLRATLRAEGRPEGPGRGPGVILLSLTDRSEQEALERMRADFIANASHELRTPLASLIGFIETLQGPAANDAPARIRFLSIMASQAARMRRLIDNLLSLSRIQMHEHERPSGLVAVDALLRHVADEHEPQIKASGITLSIEIESNLPQVPADADQLVQVLHNLLDNALKYAGRRDRAGRVLLAARRPDPGRDPSADGVVLVVEDDGPGIAAQHVPRLTERFYRVEEGIAGKAGSGLGLAIVKHIVGRHAGRLVIDGRPGLGARFSVWLPPAIPRAAATGSAGPAWPRVTP